MLKPGTKARFAVLVSGSGTNLQAFLDRASAGTLAADVAVVASDRPDAYGLVRASNAGIPAHVVDYGIYRSIGMNDPALKDLQVDLEALDRTQKILKNPDPEKRLLQLARLVLAERELSSVLDRYRPDFICLAGFMRLLSPFFLSRYNRENNWRVLNIHPSLLPAFPGQYGYEDTFAYGGKWGGITVHFADEGEDTGPIIAQAVYPIWPEDDLETIRRRGLGLEYEVYSQCVNWFVAGQVATHSGESGRTRALITDPCYGDILRRWMALAFQQQ